MRYRRGFTLIELMVALALAGLLMGLAVPTYNQFVQNQRATSLANKLVTAANLARSEAVRRSDGVTLCASNDGTKCVGAWTDGWIVRETGGDVIRRWEPLVASANLSESGKNKAINYNSQGATDGTSTFTFTSYYDDCTGDNTRTIQIDAAGRTSVTRDDSQCN